MLNMLQSLAAGDIKVAYSALLPGMKFIITISLGQSVALRLVAKQLYCY